MRQDAKRILPERQREKESERKSVAQYATIIRAASPIAVIISRQSSGNNKTGVYNGEDGRDAK